MNIPQISIFVENKPGQLQNVLKILGDEKINIITLTIADTSDFGILRLIVNKPDKSIDILKKNHITCAISEVIAIEIDDNPGSLYKTVETLNLKKLNIEYIYAFLKKRSNKTVMMFRFEDIETAKKVLNESDLNVVCKEEIMG